MLNQTLRWIRKRTFHWSTNLQTCGMLPRCVLCWHCRAVALLNSISLCFPFRSFFLKGVKSTICTCGLVVPQMGHRPNSWSRIWPQRLNSKWLETPSVSVVPCWHSTLVLTTKNCRTYVFWRRPSFRLSAPLTTIRKCNHTPTRSCLWLTSEDASGCACIKSSKKVPPCPRLVGSQQNQSKNSF